MAKGEDRQSSSLHLLKGSYNVFKIVVKGSTVIVICAAAVSGAPTAVMGARMMYSGYEAYGAASVALDALSAVGMQVLYHPKASFTLLTSTGLISFCTKDILEMCGHFNQVFWGVGGAISGLVFGGKAKNDNSCDVVDTEEDSVQLMAICEEGLIESGDLPIIFLGNGSNPDAENGVDELIIDVTSGAIVVIPPAHSDLKEGAVSVMAADAIEIGVQSVAEVRDNSVVEERDGNDADTTDLLADIVGGSGNTEDADWVHISLDDCENLEGSTILGDSIV